MRRVKGRYRKRRLKQSADRLHSYAPAFYKKKKSDARHLDKLHFFKTAPLTVVH
ncbi:uncharacterized protein METZ01_LOCUS365858 [marine metagenome]|uniref:Uncharacterized protein n=1 Tax=marine metagenome TaxID=408172 RepID=A0A382SSV7_9ZZZZ